MIKYLIDTNIFVAILKGNKDFKNFIEINPSGLDTTVYVELIQGAKDKPEVQKIEKYLTRFELIHFSKEISQRTIRLIRTYSKSHSLMSVMQRLPRLIWKMT